MSRIEYSNSQHVNATPRQFQNYISTTLYHFYDFIPLSLWNQLRRVTNIYFIALSIISFFPQIATISRSASIIPVTFIICFSIAFDLGEDFMRYLKDRRSNRKRAYVLRDRDWHSIEYQHVRPGDIVRVQADQEICADLLLLSFKGVPAYAYIETANLDGEKHLKPRVPVFEKFLTEADLLQTYPTIEVDLQPPVELLERFEGNFVAVRQDGRRVETRLSVSNFLPRSCLLKNTDQVIGMVVYTGKQTKIMMNTKKRRVKVSKIEQKMNWYTFVLIVFVMLMLFALSLYAVLTFRNNFFFERQFFTEQLSFGVMWVILVLRYLLIINTIIPISLIVTLQIAKVVMSWFYLLEKRKDKVRIFVNTLNIHEELGQIDYVLSDKTGTLTENKMVLRHFQTRNKTFNIKNNSVAVDSQPFRPFEMRSSDNKAVHLVEEELDMDFIYFIALNTCHECFSEPKKDFSPQEQEKESSSVPTINVSDHPPGSSMFISTQELKVNPTNMLTEEMQQTVMLSHMEAHSPKATPVKKFFDGFHTPHDKSSFSGNFRTNAKVFLQNPDASRFDIMKESLEIQGPSPDEIAILRASKNHCGFLFKGVTATEAVVMDKEGYDIEVRLLQVNKFNSIRKMMSVVVEVGGVIFLLAKGADSTVMSKLRRNKDDAEVEAEQLMLKKSDQFVNEGLRMMYVAAKVISKNEWQTFEQRIREANQSQNYEEEMRQIQTDLEAGLTLIGSTAIEDKLQEHLRASIEQIQKANIKLWVITGDKMETAENIAYASGVFRQDRQLVALKQIEDLAKADNPLGQNLIIDGEFFGGLLTAAGEDLVTFRNTIMEYQNVVFSRTNANQKVEVVKIVKAAGKITLAIGDGANDVNMIQEAHVGVGIYGQEGKQASNAADFAISRFADLGELIFNHGRLSYNRVSDLIMFFFYKNFMFTIPQFIFAFYCDFSGSLVFTDWYIILYNLLFTSFVATARSVYNKDVYGYGNRNNRIIEIYTYYIGKKNRGLNPRNFFLHILGAIIEVLLLFYFIYACYGLHAYEGAREANWEFMVMIVSAVIIFHQVNKIIYLTNIFLIIQALFYSTGYWLFILYIAITDNVLAFGSFRVNQQLWTVGGFWLPLVFILSVLFLLNIMYIKIQEIFFPTVFQLIRERVPRFSDQNCEEIVKKCAADAESKKGLLRWIFN